MNLTAAQAEKLRQAFAEREQEAVGFELTFVQIQMLPITQDCPECER